MRPAVLAAALVVVLAVHTAAVQALEEASAVGRPSALAALALEEVSAAECLGVLAEGVLEEAAEQLAAPVLAAAAPALSAPVAWRVGHPCLAAQLALPGAEPTRAASSAVQPGCQEGHLA